MRRRRPLPSMALRNPSRPASVIRSLSACRGEIRTSESEANLMQILLIQKRKSGYYDWL